MALHLHPAPDTGPGEAAIAAAMMLKPLYDRLSALLGQAAGLLLLTTAGADPEAERLHLVSLSAQYAEAEEALRTMAPAPLLPAAAAALRCALPIIGEILEALSNREPESDCPLPALLERLLEARRLLLAGSAPRLGIGLVDLTGACCAGPH
jgi:hypothetical protein